MKSPAPIGPRSLNPLLDCCSKSLSSLDLGFGAGVGEGFTAGVGVTVGPAFGAMVGDTFGAGVLGPAAGVGRDADFTTRPLSSRVKPSFFICFLIPPESSSVTHTSPSTVLEYS